MYYLKVNYDPHRSAGTMVNLLLGNLMSNLRKIKAEREHPFCKFCNKKLIMGKTVSAYKRIKEDTCDKCNKLRLKSKKIDLPRKLNKSKPRKIKDSVQQRIMFEELKRRLNPEYLKYNFPVRTLVISPIGKKSWNIRYIDVADLKNNVAYEYDGERFHTSKKDKEKRDIELTRAGWKIIHINKHNFSEILNEMDKHAQ